MSKNNTPSTDSWVYDPDHDIVVVEENVVVMINSHVELSSIEYSGPGFLVQVASGTVFAGYIYDPLTEAFSPPPPPPVDNSSDARWALSRSDITVLRCIEHGIDVPGAWVTYRAALRPIAGYETPYAAMPTRPAYPVGS